MFTLLAYSLGLLGVFSVILLYAVIVWRAFAIAFEAHRLRRPFASQLACGIGTWIGLQAGGHVAANLTFRGLGDLTLPLLGYGGTSMVVTCIAIALLLRVDRENRAHPPPEQQADFALGRPEEGSPTFRGASFHENLVLCSCCSAAPKTRR